MSTLAADPSVMDALEAKNNLTKAGVPPAQAEAQSRVTERQSRAIAQATAREEIAKNAANKTEFAKLSDKVDNLTVGFAEMRTKLTMLIWTIGIIAAPLMVAAMKTILTN